MTKSLSFKTLNQKNLKDKKTQHEVSKSIVTIQKEKQMQKEKSKNYDSSANVSNTSSDHDEQHSLKLSPQNTSIITQNILQKKDKKRLKKDKDKDKETH